MTGQTFGVQPSELFISSDKCILLLFLSRLQFPPLLPGMEVKTDGETDVKAHLVLRGKMVIQVLDYRDIEPQMSILISNI